jgi:hypothetical protein
LTRRFTGVIRRTGPIEQVIEIVAGVINCKDKLTALIRGTTRLLDLNVTERAGRERIRAGVRPDARRQSGLRVFVFAGRDEPLLGNKNGVQPARPDGEEQPSDQSGGEGTNEDPSLPPW